MFQWRSSLDRFPQEIDLCFFFGKLSVTLSVARYYAVLAQNDCYFTEVSLCVATAVSPFYLLRRKGTIFMTVH